jgi:hypothetical protein
MKIKSGRLKRFIEDKAHREGKTFPKAMHEVMNFKSNPNAPYIARPEKAGTPYKKSNKFFPREELYMGKSKKGHPVEPNDLTKPGAKKMPVSGPKRLDAAILATAKLASENKAVSQVLNALYKVSPEAYATEEDNGGIWISGELSNGVYYKFFLAPDITLKGEVEFYPPDFESFTSPFESFSIPKASISRQIEAVLHALRDMDSRPQEVLDEGFRLSSRLRVMADDEAIISFKVFHNTKDMNPVVEAVIKPQTAEEHLELVLAQAGFEKVRPGVYDRPGSNIKEAMEAFKGALSIEDIEIVESSPQAFVVSLEPISTFVGAGVKAALEYLNEYDTFQDALQDLLEALGGGGFEEHELLDGLKAILSREDWPDAAAKISIEELIPAAEDGNESAWWDITRILQSLEESLETTVTAKATKEAQEAVRRKLHKMKNEDRPWKQKVAIALEEARRKGYRSIKPNPNKNKVKAAGDSTEVQKDKPSQVPDIKIRNINVYFDLKNTEALEKVKEYLTSEDLGWDDWKTDYAMGIIVPFLIPEDGMASRAEKEFVDFLRTIKGARWKYVKAASEAMARKLLLLAKRNHLIQADVATDFDGGVIIEPEQLRVLKKFNPEVEQDVEAVDEDDPYAGYVLSDTSAEELKRVLKTFSELDFDAGMDAAADGWAEKIAEEIRTWLPEGWTVAVVGKVLPGSYTPGAVGVGFTVTFTGPDGEKIVKDFEPRAAYYEVSDSSLDDAMRSWTWATWLGHPSSPFFSQEFVDAYNDSVVLSWANESIIDDFGTEEEFSGLFHSASMEAAILHAIRFHTHVLSTQPQGDSIRAWVTLSTPEGLGKTIVFESTLEGIKASVAGTNKTLKITERTSPQDILSWASQE